MNDPEGREIYIDANGRKTVSTLRRLLMEAGTDALLDYLHGSHLQFVLRKAPGVDAYEFKLFGEGMVRYRAKGISPRSAIADALAAFLTHENDDYHAVLGSAWGRLRGE